MLLRQIFDPALAQYAYLIGCQKTGEALLIDPERDVDRYWQLARENGLRITAVAETHIHADFVSGAQELVADDSRIHVYLSDEGGPDWSYRWTTSNMRVTWLKHGSRFSVGNILIEAVHSPGHTPEHMSFLIVDQGGGADLPIALATGDFLFVGDVGRPDLLETAAGVAGVMEPSARQLWHSLTERLRGLPEFLQILPGHGAGSACGKALGAVPTSVLGYERRFNSALCLARENEDLFVKDILSGQPEPPLYFARMKRVNRDGIAITGGRAEVSRLSKDEFLLLKARDALQVLDLRENREAFAQGHIPQSVHTPFGSPFYLMAAGSYVEPQEKIVLVVGEASHVDEAVRQLYRIGLDQVLGFLVADEVKDLMTESTERLTFARWNHAELPENGVILDVRNSSEFSAGHLPGALSAPYTRLRPRLEQLPSDKQYFVHCGTGKRALLAASFLQSRGYSVTYVDGVCADCERIASAQGVTH